VISKNSETDCLKCASLLALFPTTSLLARSGGCRTWDTALFAVSVAVLLAGCTTMDLGIRGTQDLGATEQETAIAPGQPRNRGEQPVELAAAIEVEEGFTPIFNGTDLTGWRIIAEYDFEEHGKVYEKDGTIILEEGSPMTGIAWTGDFPKDDYEVALEAMRVTGSDFFCGMTFPIGTSWLTLIVGGWGGMVVGLSNIDGLNASENQTTQGVIFELGRWYHIRLRVTAAEVEAWINDEKMIDLPRAHHKFDIWWEQEPVKPFGVTSWHTGAALRNIMLRRLRK